MIYNWFGGSYKDPATPRTMFARFAVEPEKLFTIFGEYRIPEDQKQAFLQRARRLRDRPRPGQLVQAQRWRPDSHHGRHLSRATSTSPCAAIFDSPRASEVMYFNRSTWKIDARGPARAVGMFNILIDDPAIRPRRASHRRPVPQLHPQTKTETEQAFVVGFLSLLGNVKMFLLAISGAVMFTILLVSANTMAMSVRERVREVGRAEDPGLHARSHAGAGAGRSRRDFAGGRRHRLSHLDLFDARRGQEPVWRFPAADGDVQPGGGAGLRRRCRRPSASSARWYRRWSASRIPIVEALRSTD